MEESWGVGGGGGLVEAASAVSAVCPWSVQDVNSFVRLKHVYYQASHPAPLPAEAHRAGHGRGLRAAAGSWGGLQWGNGTAVLSIPLRNAVCVGFSLALLALFLGPALHVRLPAGGVLIGEQGLGPRKFLRSFQARAGGRRPGQGGATQR